MSEQHRDKVQTIFSKTAQHYDLMNDCMSLGMHYGWKKIAIQHSYLYPGDKALDLASGTGDMCYYLRQTYQNQVDLFAADANIDMLNKGRDRLYDQGVTNIHYCQCYAESLPYKKNSFQLVISAFGFRNFTDHRGALKEMYRTLKPGGQVMILEFSQPENPLIQTLYQLHATYAIPWLGQQIANDSESYQYLVDSIAKHPSKKCIKAWMEDTGFKLCKIETILGGLVALHQGVKC